MHIISQRFEGDATMQDETAKREAEPGADARPRAEHATSGQCIQFQRAIEFIGRRWVGTIVYVLLDGPYRFNELLARVPNVSDRLLTERLRELEAAGIVTREVHPGPPVRVVYELTASGRALSDVIGGVVNWAHDWMPDATH
jgi:DNA-binding HxlR family transcriptional regulator